MKAAFRGALRLASSITLWLAVSLACCVLFLHLLRAATGHVPAGNGWDLKSGVPLILIGTSYLSLLATLRRTPWRRLLGILVGSAFILWGCEQFISNRAVTSLIDDLVAFLFVLDLGLVIREQVQGTPAEPPPKEAIPGREYGDL